MKMARCKEGVKLNEAQIKCKKNESKLVFLEFTCFLG